MILAKALLPVLRICLAVPFCCAFAIVFTQLLTDKEFQPGRVVNDLINFLAVCEQVPQIAQPQAKWNLAFLQRLNKFLGVRETCQSVDILPRIGVTD